MRQIFKGKLNTLEFCGESLIENRTIGKMQTIIYKYCFVEHKIKRLEYRKAATWHALVARCARRENEIKAINT